MMRATVSILAVIALTPISACSKITDSGVTVTETRELAEFDEVEFSIGGEFTITIDKRTPLTLRGDDNILPLIKTEVRNRRLVVSTDASFHTRYTPQLTISVPSLRAVTVRGSGEVAVGSLDEKRFIAELKGSGDLAVTGKANELSAILSGSGDVRIADLNAKSISVELRGSGDVKLAGTTDDFRATVRGNGDVHAFDLQARNANCSVSGSGSINTAVKETLDASVTGSGDVHYRGDPKINRSIAGSGSVRPASGKPA